MTKYDVIKREILDKIIEYKRIIIVRHIRPDGDCIGASLGLRAIIRSSFPQKEVYSIGKTSSSYLSFIGAEDMDISSNLYEDALVIVVDTANRDRIDNDFYHKAKFIIKIDHHIPVEDYGHINYVREDMPATTLIIVDFYKTFADTLVLNDKASLALFTGAVTDTGRFKFSGVDGNVFALTSILFNNPLNITDIYNRLYIKDAAEYKLQGYIYNKFKTTKNGVAYFVITKRILKKFNLPQEGAAASVNSLDSIKNHLIWMFFVENKDKSYRVRIRSRHVVINEMATLYGGGGHAHASGATAINNRQIKEIVAHADNILAEYKKNNPEAF